MTIKKEDIKKIAIIRIGKIGDLIVSNFALHKIRTTFPQAHILLVTLPRVAELLQYSTDFNEIKYFKRGFDLVRLLAFLRSYKADLLIDFNDNPSGTSKYIAQFSNAKYKIAFDFDKNTKYLTTAVSCPDREQTHIMDRIRLIPEAMGLTFEKNEIRPMLHIGTKEMANVQRQIQRANPKGKPLIAVNLSAGEKSRYWKVDYWWKLLMDIRRVEKDVMFILLSAPTDAHIAKDVGTPFSSDNIMYPAYTDFHSFASYIALSDLLISPDTSAIHIACAKSIPLIGLYPAIAWNYSSWHPVNTKFQAVKSDFGDVSNISPQKVFDAYCQIRSDVKALLGS